MVPDKANNERDSLRLQLSFHRVMNLGLLLLELITLGILGFVLLKDNVKIIPPEVRRPYEIGANHANKDYLLDMAGYVLGTIMTVTPDNVDHNNKVILKMADPSGYGDLKTALDAAAIRMKKERVTTIWVPRKEEVSERSMQVKVTGNLKTYIADKLTSEREKVFLVQFISTISGRLYVAKVQEIVKPDPGKSGSF